MTASSRCLMAALVLNCVAVIVFFQFRFTALPVTRRAELQPRAPTEPRSTNRQPWNKYDTSAPPVLPAASNLNSGHADRVAMENHASSNRSEMSPSSPIAAVAHPGTDTQISPLAAEGPLLAAWRIQAVRMTNNERAATLREMTLTERVAALAALDVNRQISTLNAMTNTDRNELLAALNIQPATSHQPGNQQQWNPQAGAAGQTQRQMITGGLAVVGLKESRWPAETRHARRHQPTQPPLQHEGIAQFTPQSNTVVSSHFGSRGRCVAALWLVVALKLDAGVR